MERASCDLVRLSLPGAAVKAGRLDDRIELFSAQAGVDDGYGTIPSQWVSRGYRFCEYQPGRTREVFETANKESEMPAVFMVRRDDLTSQITATWKLIHEGTVYDITGAVNIGRDAIRLVAVGGEAPVVDS